MQQLLVIWLRHPEVMVAAQARYRVDMICPLCLDASIVVVPIC